MPIQAFLRLNDLNIIVCEAEKFFTDKVLTNFQNRVILYIQKYIQYNEGARYEDRYKK